MRSEVMKTTLQRPIQRFVCFHSVSRRVPVHGQEVCHRRRNQTKTECKDIPLAGPLSEGASEIQENGTKLGVCMDL